MIKYSVKKPFTVLVAVIIVLVIGLVSLTGMKTDLLPDMSMPYMMVITRRLSGGKPGKSGGKRYKTNGGSIGDDKRRRRRDKFQF